MDDFEVRLNTLLTDTYNNISKVEEKTLRESGLNATISEVHLIEEVGGQDCATVSSLAKRLGITTASVTVAVNKLAERGYITKEKNPEDGRSVYLRLTKQGLRVYRVHRYFHRRMVKAVITDLEEHEKQTIYDFVSQLNKFFIESVKSDEE